MAAASGRVRPMLSLILALGVSVIAGCGVSDDAAPEPTAVPDEPVLTVETWAVGEGSILERISAPGTIVARRESRIGPEVRGRLERIFVEEGDRVAAGDPLFQIEREPYEVALRQAEARRDRTRAERKKLELDVERGRQLRQKDVLAEQRIDELTTLLEVAQAAEREAIEQVALARRNLDLTLVKAPYAASVAARLEDEGTTAQAQPQTIVLVLQETAELEAEVTIPEAHLASIRVGDAALLYVQGLDRPIAAWVSAVGDVIDPTTRTYLVKMRVPNEEQQLKAGVFARVEILPGEKRGVLVIPRDAVRREDGRSYVLVVRGGRAELTRVRLGVASERRVEVVRGLQPGDQVVVGADARTLGPGMRVEPVIAEPVVAEPAVSEAGDPPMAAEEPHS